LLARGERQGDWLGERLDRSDEVRPALIVSSPFARALQTAQRVAKVVGIADDDIVRDALQIKRVSYPDDITGTASFLASDDSDYMTGQMIHIDGGWCIQ